MSDTLRWLAVPMAWLTAWLTTRACCHPASRLYFLDHPNDRSLHSQPIPRTGGVGVMAGSLVGVGLAAASGWLPVNVLLAVGGASVLALLGLLDDRHTLPARLRFLVQVLVAAGFLYGAGFSLGWAMGLLLLMSLVWLANLYNFMDGSDGLAGGMALFGFSAYAVAAYLGGRFGLALACAAVAAGAAGFLLFNFHPARIFMGDVGSVPLGFLAGSLGLVGWGGGAWPLWFPLLVFAPFVLDATVTLLRRALHGEKVWQAHRSHYYQRMVRMGLGHRGTALRAYGLMLGTGISAVLILPSGFSLQCVTLTMWAIVFLAVGVWVDQRWRHFEAAEAAKL